MSDLTRTPGQTAERCAAVLDEIERAVVGNRRALELVMNGILAGGHILLEDLPGLGKTLIARSFARTLGLDFARIQFTPDLLPSDVVGAPLYDQRTGQMVFRPGPVFTQLLLADEINRTPPKTQAALLEAMQERRVTLDGKDQRLSPRFTVVATQNPIEQQGVYPLPEAQLDRFLFKQTLPYPSEAEERAIVTRHSLVAGNPDPAAMGVETVAGAEEIEGAVAAVSAIRLAGEIADYVVALIRASRETPDLETGASPRAGAMLALAARARAAMEGRDYAIPDDVKALILPALRHRVILSPAAEIEGRAVDDILSGLVERVEAPR